MQKKLLALAVAGALVPAAAIAQSSVEIYGRANLSVGSWEADGATAGPGADFDRRLRVVDSASRVGFRINESLGGGMRAFAVIETGVNIDSGSQSGQGAPNGSTGFWASRDSYLGLGGSWGDVRFGRQSVWWSNGVISQTGANYIDNAVDGLINNPSITAIPSARTSNVISYNTPTMGGFNASLSYSPQSESAGAGEETDGRLLGITGRYTSGALRAQIDWANRQDQSTPGTPQTEVTGLKLGVGWAYAPGSQISGIIGNLENENITVAGVGTGDAERMFWLINWEHMIGQFQLLAQLYTADEVDGPTGDIDETGVRGITLAGKYFLSKRTGVYVSFHNVRNDDLAFADLTGGGFSSAGALTAANAGADVKSIGVGVIHNF